MNCYLLPITIPQSLHDLYILDNLCRQDLCETIMFRVRNVVCASDLGFCNH